jgi:2-hydroxy-3-oxopropionate reductase
VTRIGFIGLGIMGKPMARNLLEAGFSLTVHNRSRAAVDELAADGADVADSPPLWPAASTS